MIGISILGATGSIGTSTLDVIARHPERYRVVAVTAHRDVDGMAAICATHQPALAVMADPDAAERLQQRLQQSGLTETVVAGGYEALAGAAEHPDAPVVMAAIVGAVGLASTLAAVRKGKRVLLANKEALVMTGAPFMQLVEACGAELLPIDSEHNAVFQCLPEQAEWRSARGGVSRVMLTASGGPFRTTPLERLAAVTPAQACAHPNWSMGRKISVDSATMMNKGLEVVEARWLFGVSHDAIDVVIHPQSVIHSLVSYVDGSVLAQLGNPDMRTPIAHALAWPERIDAGVAPLDLIGVGELNFEAPDHARFPCLRLAYEALKRGGTATAILNAANEVAVAAFLENGLGYTDIPVVIEETLAEVTVEETQTVELAMAADASARQVAGEVVHRLTSGRG